jgi:hypothetical protein
MHATLLKRVETVRRKIDGSDRVGVKPEMTSRFLSATGGNRPDCDEVVRTLFARAEVPVDDLPMSVPVGIRDPSRKRAVAVFATHIGSGMHSVERRNPG